LGNAFSTEQLHNANTSKGEVVKYECVERYRKWLWPTEYPGTSRQNRSEKRNISIRITANELFSHGKGGGLFCALSVLNAHFSPPQLTIFRKSDVLPVLNGLQCLRTAVQPCTRIMRVSILLYNDVSAEQGRTVMCNSSDRLTGVALLCNGACLAFSLRLSLSLSLLSSAYQLTLLTPN